MYRKIFLSKYLPLPIACLPTFNFLHNKHSIIGMLLVFIYENILLLNFDLMLVYLEIIGNFGLSSAQIWKFRPVT